MFELPKTTDGSRLMSFLLSVGLLASITFGIIWWYGSGVFAVTAMAGILLTVIAMIAGFIYPDPILPLYRFWNRLIKKYSVLLQWWVTTIAFYLIFTAVGVFGKSRQFKTAEYGQSMWHERTTLGNDIYKTQYNDRYDRGEGTRPWVYHFIRWSISTQNKWMIFLVPFLVLLKIHKVEEEKKSPEDIYTLY